MLSEKGQAEIHHLLGSGLIENWADADRQLKRTVSLLLKTRADLLKLYFIPQAWQAIEQAEPERRAALMLCLIKAAVIEHSQRPAITHWEQAVFYRGTHMQPYAQMAQEWAEQHPERCHGRFKPLSEQQRIALPNSDA